MNDISKTVLNRRRSQASPDAVHQGSVQGCQFARALSSSSVQNSSEPGHHVREEVLHQHGTTETVP